MNTFDVIWKNFKRNKRSIYSLYIFLTLFILSLFSELISNNKPIIMSVEGSMYYPYIIEYTERDFGGELETTPDYKGYFISNLLDNSNILISLSRDFTLLILTQKDKEYLYLLSSCSYNIISSALKTCFLFK